MNKTLLLVKKDLIYLFTSLRRLVLMSVIFSLVIPIGNITFAFLVPIMLAYLLTYGIFAYEEKNKMHLLNASLPVDRKQLCLCKYLTALIYTAGSLLMTFLGIGVALGIQSASNEQTSLEFILAAACLLFVTALVYHAVILPLLVYFGTIKMKYIMFILYVGAFVIMGILGKEGLDRTQLFLEQRVTLYSSLMLLLAGMIVYVASYIISVSLYQTKEFK